MRQDNGVTKTPAPSRLTLPWEVLGNLKLTHKVALIPALTMLLLGLMLLLALQMGNQQTAALRSLARLRGLADFEGVRSLSINELDEKVFTTSGGAGDGGCGNFGRRLGWQLEPELLD